MPNTDYVMPVLPDSRITTTAKVLRSIADDESMVLFRTIAQSTDGIDTKHLQDKIKFIRKQYYSRLSRMTKSALLKKKRGKYYLTAFGKVVYDLQAKVDSALTKFWKLEDIA